MKKRIISICLLTCSLLTITVGSCSRHISDHNTVTGIVNAKEADVVPMLPGRIEQLTVHEGDSVKKGALIATLKLNALQARLAQATSMVNMAKSNLTIAKKGVRSEIKEMAEISLKAAQNEFETAKNMLERAQKLYEAKAIGKARFEQAQLAFNLAKDHVEIAQKNRKMLQKGSRPEQIKSLFHLLEGTESMRQAVSALFEEKRQIAPISGEVAKIYLHEGEIASIAFPIATIVDLTDQWVSLSVREDVLAKIHKGDTTEFYLPALDKKVRATITHISPLGDFATWRATSDSGSFDLKSFEITLKPVSVVPGMRPGMTARWNIPR